MSFWSLLIAALWGATLDAGTPADLVAQVFPKGTPVFFQEPFNGGKEWVPGTYEGETSVCFSKSWRRQDIPPIDRYCIWVDSQGSGYKSQFFSLGNLRKSKDFEDLARDTNSFSVGTEILYRYGKGWAEGSVTEKFADCWRLRAARGNDEAVPPDGVSALVRVDPAEVKAKRYSVGQTVLVKRPNGWFEETFVRQKNGRVTTYVTTRGSKERTVTTSVISDTMPLGESLRTPESRAKVKPGDKVLRHYDPDSCFSPYYWEAEVVSLSTTCYGLDLYYSRPGSPTGYLPSQIVDRSALPPPTPAVLNAD